MAILSLQPAQMQMALTELDQALYHHDQWYEALQTTLICGLPPDQRDIDKDAHRKCRFGQWFYGPGFDKVGRHPGFPEIESEHERMHRLAASMLLASSNRVPISPQDYERFINALRRMRLEILTVKREFEDALFNLDPLTGTASRIGMLTKLREQQEMVRRKVHSCCLGIMDLDRFKVVNDNYGHIVGDQVLVTFARYAMAHLRPYDRIFRYGGEEFLICMTDADLKTGREIVDRLREELSQLPFRSEGKQSFHVTASFGLTLLDPDLPVEQSIDRADKALYAAKAAGRDRTVTWDVSMA